MCNYNFRYRARKGCTLSFTLGQSDTAQSGTLFIIKFNIDVLVNGQVIQVKAIYSLQASD